jgi:hypothetical protein
LKGICKRQQEEENNKKNYWGSQKPMGKNMLARGEKLPRIIESKTFFLVDIP